MQIIITCYHISDVKEVVDVQMNKLNDKLTNFFTVIFEIWRCKNLFRKRLAPQTQQTRPRLITHFFLNSLNFLLSKSRFFMSSNTKRFIYQVKNAALRRLAAR
jgi:hypothetical protein